MSGDRVHYLWRDPSVARSFRTAISLHSHTRQSKESLGFIPRYAKTIPGLSGLVQAQERKYERVHGTQLDFDNAWWTPPLSPREAYELERNQIEQQLSLKALVSLTDHDDIEAPMHLHVLSEMNEVPISVEWTVPYGASFFHVGVHNLPSKHAHATMEVLTAFTASPDETRLRGVFEMLAGYRSTLIVLNHPLWDEPGIGTDAHRALLNRFVANYRPYLHAAELNGLRSWNENATVAQFSKETGLPLISGGDRHGCEPNANVNLTNASTFPEFVDEVRNNKLSTVLFLNQYREPVRLRLLQGVLDVVREYPELPEGRRLWTDRVFFQRDDGSIRSLSSLWTGDGPPVVKVFMNGVRLLESRRLRVALRIALSERQEGAT